MDMFRDKTTIDPVATVGLLMNSLQGGWGWCFEINNAADGHCT